MRTMRFILALLAIPAVAHGQLSTLRGTITYIAGDAVYTSIGNAQGIRDSALVYVLAGRDTVATLKVFATSSKSSVCTVVQKRRPFAINDPVIATAAAADATVDKAAPPPPAEPSARRPEQKATAGEQPPRQNGAVQGFSVHGGVRLQYASSSYTGASRIITQPGIVINLRGTSTNLPLGFEVYGNIRSLIVGTQSPFSPRSLDQMRIYRLSVDYNDTRNRISAGRISPLYAPMIGFVDGMLYARSLGDVTLGVTAGFEPAFNERAPSSQRKKIALFGNYTSQGGLRSSVSLAYARTYSGSSLDREALSSSVTVFPTTDVFILFQSDVDLRSVTDQELTLSPQLTSLIANANYRVIDAVSIGAGITSVRPYYSFAAVNMLPDSLLDRKLRTSPSLSATVRLPAGISFYNNYSPRSSEEGFGHEYFNYTSVGMSDLMNQGLTARLSMTLNSTVFTSIRGYGASLQKSVASVAEITLRYQFYRYVAANVNERSTSKSLALDVLLSVMKNLTLWGSVERLTGLGAEGYSVFGELGWKF
jgi:hypothetical protein